MAGLSDKEIREAIQEEGWFGIKKPTERRAGGRSSFSIQQHTKLGTKTLPLDEVTLVNERYRNGVLTHEEALKHLTLIKDKLYEIRDAHKPKIKLSQANDKVLQEFLKKRYPNHKQNKMADFNTMKCDLRRALGSLEGLPILTATQDELQEAVDNKFQNDVNKQRRVVSRLNSILSYLGKDFALDKFPEDYRDVRHLTPNEMKELSKNVDDQPLKKLLLEAAFGSGLRQGELFGLRASDVRGENHIFVSRQMKSDLRYANTKTRKPRDVVLLPEYAQSVKEWANVPENIKKEMRNLNYSRFVKEHCLVLFKKECVFHDLRHSYAVHCLSQGMSMDWIALFLGNSVTVCEKYYTGFRATSTIIDAALGLLKKD